MKKLIVFNILVFVFILASCSNNKSQSKIYGKWKSEKSPEITLDFAEDNFLKMEMSSQNGGVYKENHPFIIVDEKTAVITETTQPEYKAKIRATLESDDKIRLDCQIQRSAEGKSMLDALPLCTNYIFKRLE